MKNNIFKKFNEDENFRNRTILVVVIIIGIFALVFNFKNLNNIMSNSLKSDNEKSLEKMYSVYNQLKSSGKLVEDNSSNNANYGNINSNSNDLSTIANDGKDTDGDGITDYDEVNIFGTSMYLKDSDGDGISDDQEIKNGTDPNCAEGTKCGVTTSSTTNTSNVTSSYGYGSNNTKNNIDINSLDPSKIREELKNIVPDNIKTMIDSMTDDQVKELFLQLYNTQNTTNNTSTTQSSSNNNYIDELKKKLPQFTPQQISMMKDMDESEIVDILVESGIADKKFFSQFKSGEIKNIIIGDN